MSKQPWGFYGRRDELARLAAMLGRGRWFFVKLSGRRRIGKTTLVQQARLAALAVPVASTSFRPVDQLVQQADERLADAEGHGLERLVSVLYEERSRKGLGDFPLTHTTRGWWDRGGTEIDLVAIADHDRRIRLGSCKRLPDKLIADLPRFDGHIERFLESTPRYRSWQIEKVAIAPSLSVEHRRACVAAGYLPQSLTDLTEGLLP